MASGESWPGLGPGGIPAQESQWERLCLERQETHKAASPFLSPASERIKDLSPGTLGNVSLCHQRPSWHRLVTIKDDNGTPVGTGLLPACTPRS